MRRRDFLNCAAGLTAYTTLLSDARAAGTSRAPKLKLTGAKAAPMKDTGISFVRVYTDQGLSGTGEITGSMGSEDIVNKDLGPKIAGRDPLDIEGIYYDLWSNVLVRGSGGPYLSAISGIEMALWDLAGKALSLPLYRLMSGRAREKVAVYFDARDPKHAAEVVRSTGVRAIKAPIGPHYGGVGETMDGNKRTGLRLTTRQIDAIGAYAGTLRDAIGPHVEMALDCRTLFDEESAIQVAKAVEHTRPMWMGEPTTSDNPEIMHRIRRASRVPIACGENIYTRYGFRPFIEQQAVSVIQPDMSKTGGLLETKKIAQMAETYTIEVAPHGAASPLGQLAYAHVCSTIPNFVILEWGTYLDEGVNRLVKRPAVKDGVLEVPDSPGIGAELNQDAIRAALPAGYDFPA